MLFHCINVYDCLSKTLERLNLNWLIQVKKRFSSISLSYGFFVQIFFQLIVAIFFSFSISFNLFKNYFSSINFISYFPSNSYFPLAIYFKTLFYYLNFITLNSKSVISKFSSHILYSHPCIPHSHFCIFPPYKGVYTQKQEEAIPGQKLFIFVNKILIFIFKLEMKTGDVELFLKFGDDSNEKNIMNIHLQLQLNEQKVLESIKNLNIKQEKPNDLYLRLEFSVIQGREKQAIQYLQKGMDEPDEEEIKLLNPIQRLLHRPKSTGKVQFSYKPGAVVVNYLLYDDFTYDSFPKEVKGILEMFKSEKLNPNLVLDFLIKGEQNSLNKERNSIYPNYVQLKLALQKPSLLKIYENCSQFLPEQVFYNPLLKMVGFGCRKAEINFSFTHFKKILEMYKKAANIEESKKPTSYLSKNILKNKIKINLFQNNIYGEGTIDFSNEADLERIISVLWKTSEKGYKNL